MLSSMGHATIMSSEVHILYGTLILFTVGSGQGELQPNDMTNTVCGLMLSVAHDNIQGSVSSNVCIVST